MISVEEKMRMIQQVLPNKNNNNNMSKKLGKTGSEIRVLGKSNQKIKKRMGV